MRVDEVERGEESVHLSRIIGTGSFLPERTVGNHEVVATLDLAPEEVFQLTGIRTRRWIDESHSTADLAAMAAERAIEAAGIDRRSIDAVLVSTTSPDEVFPSTACHVQRLLKLSHVAAFDVAASCSGFLYGLSMADASIRSGQARTCLVIAAEAKSRFLDRRDPATAILFGDGAGAAVLVGEAVQSQPASGILGIRLYAEGAGAGLIEMPAGGSRRPTTAATVHAREHVLRMQGGPLFRLAIRRLEQAVRELLKEFGVTMQEIRQVVLHQANARILNQLRERLGMPSELMYTVIERFGNTSSASLPLALDYAVREGRISRGDLVLLGAFGGGLTWATGLVRW